MRKLIAVAALGALVALPQMASAADLEQSVAYKIDKIAVATVSGDIAEALTIDATKVPDAEIGNPDYWMSSTPNSATSLKVTSNTPSTVSASIGAPLPAGVELHLGLGAEAAVPLATDPTVLDAALAATGGAVTLNYTLKAKQAAAPVPAGTATVTFTITAN